MIPEIEVLRTENARLTRYGEAIEVMLDRIHYAPRAGCDCAACTDDIAADDLAYHLRSAVMTVADAEQAELLAEVERLRGPFRCCEHCAEDVVHDVEPNAHDVDCQLCADTLRRRAESAEAERDRARSLAANLEAECARLSETVARVEALADSLEVLGNLPIDERPDGLTASVKACTALAGDLRAALTGPTETGDEPGV